MAVQCRSSTAHCPQTLWRCIAGVPLPTAHCPQVVWQCIVGVPLPIAPRQWGTTLQEFHGSLPFGSVAVHCGSSTAHCPQAVGQCIAGVPLPIAPKQWGTTL